MVLEQEVVRCKLRANVRPLKLAYLIEEDDSQALRHVIKFACTDWGGMRNFIVPIGRDGTIHRAFGAFLKPHPPDFYLDYLPGSGESDPLTRSRRSLEALLASRQPITIFDGRVMESDLGAHPLSIVPDEILDSPMRSRRFSEPPRKLTVFTFPKGDDDVYLLALFGAIFPGQEKDYAANCLVDEREISLTHRNFWSEQIVNDPTHSPLELTTCAIGPTEMSGGFPTNLPYVLVLVKDWFSLAWFWNFRAIRDATQFDRVGRRTILVPARLADDHGAISNLMSVIRTAPHLESETSNLDFIVVNADDFDRERFTKTLAAMSKVEPLADPLSTEWWLGKQDKRPREADPNRVLTYQFGIPEAPASFTEGFATPRVERIVSLRYGGDEFEFEPPPKFVNRFNSKVVIDLHSSVWDRYPRSPSVASSIIPHARWTHYGLSFRTIPSTRPANFSVVLPSLWEGYVLYFKDHGYEVSRSRSADYATAVIELIGGIERADVFADSLAYRVLQRLTLPSTLKITQRLVKAGVAVPDMEGLSRLVLDADVIEELKKVPKTAQQLAGVLDEPLKAVLHVLHSLSVVGALRRGFHLACPRCGTPSWHLLGDLEEHLRCPGCFFRFHLPVESPPGSELAWHYSLNSLVNRAMDQDSLPAILALNRLRKDGAIHGPIPGIELRLSGCNDVAAEFDFVLVRDAKLLAGECKAGTELGEKDLRNAELAASLGIAEFFFCTASQFSEPALSSVETLRGSMAKKMQIRTLQHSELFLDP